MPTLEIPGCGAVEITVECDGSELPVHQLRWSESGKQECFIASKENATFCIRVRTGNRVSQDIAVAVELDGIPINGRLLYKWRDHNITLDSVGVSKTEERPFTFGKLQLVDEDEVTAWNQPSDDELRHLGTIRLQIQAVIVSNLRPQKSFHNFSLPGDRPVSEKAKKGGSHTTRLGQAVQATSLAQQVTTRELRGYSSQEILFHYAPMDYLLAQEIMPRPEPLPSSSSSASSSAVPEVIVISDDEDENEGGVQRHISTPTLVHDSPTAVPAPIPPEPTLVHDSPTPDQEQEPKPEREFGMDVDEDSKDLKFTPEELAILERARAKEAVLAARRQSSLSSSRATPISSSTPVPAPVSVSPLPSPPPASGPSTTSTVTPPTASAVAEAPPPVARRKRKSEDALGSNGNISSSTDTTTTSPPEPDAAPTDASPRTRKRVKQETQVKREIQAKNESKVQVKDEVKDEVKVKEELIELRMDEMLR